METVKYSQNMQPTTLLKAGLYQACSHYVLKNMTERVETQ